MKKVLVLLRSVDGGTGTYLEGLLELRSSKLNIYVCVLEKPRYRKKRMDDYEYFSKKEYIPSRYSISFANASKLMHELFWLKKKIMAIKPDLIISQDPHAILLSELVRKFVPFQLSTISALHNNVFKVVVRRLPSNFQKTFNAFFGYLLRKSDAVVSVSKMLSADLQKKYSLKKIPHTISCFISSSGRPQNKMVFDATDRIIISVARMDEQKDHESLIKAFSRVHKKHPRTLLWLVGDGQKRKELEDGVFDLGLSNNVIFWGWHQNPLELMLQSHIFILSTHWEGFPLALIEAMTSGLPVIVSDCKYGPREILGNDQYGLLFPEGDVSALAKSILRLLEDRELSAYYSKQAQVRTKAFSSRRMLSEYKMLISKLTS